MHYPKDYVISLKVSNNHAYISEFLVSINMPYLINKYLLDLPKKEYSIKENDGAVRYFKKFLSNLTTLHENEGCKDVSRQI